MKIEEIASKMTFVNSTKKSITFKRVELLENLTEPYTYWVSDAEIPSLSTFIDGLKETSNHANVGDYVLCGSSLEKYVIRKEKINGLYTVGETSMVTKDIPKKVCRYSKDKYGECDEFTASWGEKMTLNDGDFLVKEDENSYYRIEQSVFKKDFGVVGAWGITVQFNGSTARSEDPLYYEVYDDDGKKYILSNKFSTLCHFYDKDFLFFSTDRLGLERDHAAFCIAVSNYLALICGETNVVVC